MAYEFTRASSQHLSTSAPITARPMTLAAWVNPKSTGTLATVVSFGETSGTGHRRQLTLSASNAISCTDTGSIGIGGIVTSVTAPINAWSHMCGVFRSSTSRTAYANGGNAVTSTANHGTQKTLPWLYFGSRYITSFGSFLDGRIAEVGVWSVELSAAEIASLAKGMTCDKIRPQNLVFYAPLIRDLQDTKGGLIITPNNGPIVAPHPRVYR